MSIFDGYLEVIQHILYMFCSLEGKYKFLFKCIESGKCGFNHVTIFRKQVRFSSG